MSGTVTGNRKYDKADKRNTADDKKEQTERYENDVRLEHDEAAQDCLTRLPHVLPDVLEQTGLTSLGVGFDRHTVNLQSFVTCLNDSLHAVTERGDDIQAYERVA